MGLPALPRPHAGGQNHLVRHTRNSRGPPDAPFSGLLSVVLLGENPCRHIGQSFAAGRTGLVSCVVPLFDDLELGAHSPCVEGHLAMVDDHGEHTAEVVLDVAPVVPTLLGGNGVQLPECCFLLAFVLVRSLGKNDLIAHRWCLSVGRLFALRL